MSAEPIRYYDRYDRTVKTERIYGEGWLRWAYENPVGRFLVWLLIKRRIFSVWYGWKMNQRSSGWRVIPFIADYEINVDEFEKSAFEFKTFNEFFYRALKPGARPVAVGERVAVFPADGRHLVFPNVDTTPGFYAKGSTFTLAQLLGEGGRPAGQQPLAETFAGGAMVISRLCPVDYHRFHFAVSGVPGTPKTIKGFLYSVSPVALRRYLHYLVENKRELTEIETKEFGCVIQMEVGATNVGSIRQSFVPGRAVAKGDEKGLFAFGGSCVITLFQRGRIRFDADLIEHSAQHLEVYAKMGDRLGEAV
jgi:phosphatidylserine decarboxylase